MALTQITSQNFNSEVTQSKTPVIIDFWAEWCGPCRMLAPVFEELSKEYEGKLKFAKLDTEAEPELTAQFGIRGIPCMIVFDKGKEVNRIVGFAPKEVLKARISQTVA